MNAEYTLTTEDVRWAVSTVLEKAQIDEVAFDRWLKKEQQMWYRKGYREGYKGAAYDNVQEQNMGY